LLHRAAAAYGSRAAGGSPSLSFSLLLSFVALLQDSLSQFALNRMPLFIGIHGAAPLVLWSIMVATVSSSFNNGGCQPLTFQKGCCICQWTVPSINGCCTLMATNSTVKTDRFRFSLVILEKKPV
jgi:hypothetical protein